MAQPSVTVTAPNGLSATLPRTDDANAVRQYFGVLPHQGILRDSTNALVQDLNSGTPPYRFDINPALLPTGQTQDVSAMVLAELASLKRPLEELLKNNPVNNTLKFLRV